VGRAKNAAGHHELSHVRLVRVLARGTPPADGPVGTGESDDIQVDAMPTPRLQQILREAITSRMDLEVLNGVREREQAQREALRALLAGDGR
jgi:hypothetical protein